MEGEAIIRDIGGLNEEMLAEVPEWPEFFGTVSTCRWWQRITSSRFQV